jgi:hypothetical protein
MSNDNCSCCPVPDWTYNYGFDEETKIFHKLQLYNLITVGTTAQINQFVNETIDHYRFTIPFDINNNEFIEIEQNKICWIRNTAYMLRMLGIGYHDDFEIWINAERVVNYLLYGSIIQ